MIKQALDGTLISSVPDIIYLTGFSSFSLYEREAFLLVTKKNQYIFTDGRYTHAVKTQVDHFQLIEIGATTPFIKQLEKIIKEEAIEKLGTDNHNLTAFEFERIKKTVKETKHFSPSEIRICKTIDEITKIKQACALGDKAFSYILKKLKPSMTEKEIAFTLEHFMRKNGADPSFDTIVAFGENAAVPHHKISNRKLKTRDLILLDFGIKHENYCSDMTRTIFLGKPTPEQKKVYETVHEAQQKAIETLKSSLAKPIQATLVDQAARDYIISQRYPSIPHSLGHGIGLEVHEDPTLGPNSEAFLQEGMVFSIEPGIYLPDNFGVRIEDLFAIQNNKLIQLTQSPSHLIEI